MIESKFLSLIYIYIYVYITRNTDTKKMRKTIPENILLFSKRVEHDFDFCDSHLIPKESKASFFQNNRVPLTFYVSLKIPFKSEKKKKKLKAIFLSLFKKIIAYLRFSFFFFFFPFYSTCTKHEYQKKKTSKKQRRIGVIDFRNRSIPEPKWERF